MRRVRPALIRRKVTDDMVKAIRAAYEALQGWRFRVEPAPSGVRVVASAGGGEPAAWFVPA